MYLKFEGPEFESGTSADGHVGEIEVLSWNHGFSQPTSPTRSGAGSGTTEQANHHNFTFSKYTDGSSTALMKNCWSGKQFDKATLTCYRADGSENAEAVKYLEVIMEHIVIANLSLSGGPGDIPVENISLDYGKIQYNYVSQKRDSGEADGNKPASHDLEARKVG
jgi:type VI secretion system secreted protein Hcp